MRPRWTIIAVSTLALVISNGLAIGGMPVFSKPIRDEFVALGIVDGTRAESFIANAANITFLMSGVFSLVGGWLFSFIRLKTLMLVGCVLLGGGLLMHSAASSIEMVYFSRFLIGGSLGFVGVAPNVVLIARVFNEKRGTPLGIVLTGTSIGGVVMPLIASPLISAYGWRTSMIAVSFLVWLLLLPAVLLFINDETQISDSSVDFVEAERTFLQTLRMPLFWLFGLCAATVFYPIFVTSQQFILYLQSPKIGFMAAGAAAVQSTLFAFSVGGKFLAGFLSDRFRAVGVMVGCSGLMFAATLVLFHLTADTALIFLLPFALGYGGTFVLLQRLASDLFGKRDIGKILGAVTLIEVVGAAVGGRVTGYLADQASGDYTFAFHGVTVAAVVAFGLALTIFALTNKQSRAVV